MRPGICRLPRKFADIAAGFILQLKLKTVAVTKALQGWRRKE
jgi:hypothetical protein